MSNCFNTGNRKKKSVYSWAEHFQEKLHFLLTNSTSQMENPINPPSRADSRMFSVCSAHQKTQSQNIWWEIKVRLQWWQPSQGAEGLHFTVMHFLMLLNTELHHGKNLHVFKTPHFTSGRLLGCVFLGGTNVWGVFWELVQSKSVFCWLRQDKKWPHCWQLCQHPKGREVWEMRWKIWHH